jgi:hypothetical protein
VFVGALCGAALWPLLTALVVWVDDANLSDGPLIVLIIPLIAVYSFLSIPFTLIGRGYLGLALVVAIWAAVGAMVADGWQTRHERKRPR